MPDSVPAIKPETLPDTGSDSGAPSFAPRPSIEARRLTKRYGSMTAIDDVSFQVFPGEIVGFLGPNGAGKSTTLRILCGLLPASSGEAWICGHSVAREPARIKPLIGYMPERNPLPEELRVIEFLRFRARLKNLSGALLRQRVDEVLDICDLNRKARRKVIGALSKGFRQRVGLADALLGNPEVILLDEPTIGLDPHQILAVRELISSLRGRMTVVLSSHILTEIEMCCDKVIIINQGQIVAGGSAERLRRDFFNRTDFLVEAQGELSAIEDTLRRSGLSLRLDSSEQIGADGFYRLRFQSLSDDVSGERIARALILDAGVEVRRLERLDPSLEDIFLAATRRSWEQTLEEMKDSRPPF